MIYENSSLDLNKSVVALAIKHKIILYEQYGQNQRVNELALFYDSMKITLCFPAALLIKYGFPVTRDVLTKALEDNLHPTELAYTCTCLDMPRRLTHR